ncbi:hypothetical protein C2845_PM01G35420 [Panicum miliaceum]|uniref:F-box domain-containing protein n=1 Tax=Panicum miliaceum TaxID=4540 RepID=A0A3L6TIQ5_PANMI|nr:hypothetical protein C2845_PM01G35420 [Panicum miliaceum]
MGGPCMQRASCLLEVIKSTHQIRDRSRVKCSAVQCPRARLAPAQLAREQARDQEAGRMEWQVDLPRLLLPDDVLAGVLRRVAPRGLAASRCVRRAWHALIDGRGMLRAGLLPHSLAGIFISYRNLQFAKFFARPPVDYDYGVPNSAILDHCNGLLLQYDWVCNPATRVWILDESSDQTERKLRQDTDLELAFPTLTCDHGPWVLENVSSDDESDEHEDEERMQVEEEFEWNPDDDNIPPTSDMEEK